MRLNQSHPLQTCITQASLHIAASFPSMQGLHPTVLQVAWPTGQTKNSLSKKLTVILLLQFPHNLLIELGLA